MHVKFGVYTLSESQSECPLTTVAPVLRSLQFAAPLVAGLATPGARGDRTVLSVDHAGLHVVRVLDCTIRWIVRVLALRYI